MPVKRYSRQRELIYRAVRDTKSHPTAEMVYQRLKPDNPNLSLGTVYRNLSLLSEEGLLVRMPFPVERYDACLTPHTHFRCRKCGNVFDFERFDRSVTCLDQVDAAAGEIQPEFKVERHDLIFYGLCSQCQA